MSFKRKGSRRMAFNPNKMDTARAQNLLGFSSNRWMDTTGGADPKSILDKALDDQMQKLSNKRSAKSTGKEKRGVDRFTRGTKKVEPKMSEVCDEYLVLHEAYQFLLQKFNNTPQQKALRAKEKEEEENALLDGVLFDRVCF